MCGIVGYIGKAKATDVLIDGLKRLEYRGYDSAGVAVLNDGQITIKKYKGRLTRLEEELRKDPIMGNVGIGHTRWATHGTPSDVNSHPHTNSDNYIAVVHNGIIENYMELKEELINAGYVFVSDTDTEVIVHLLDSLYRGDIVVAVQQAAKRITGSYALGVLCNSEPDRIIAIRKDSPLIVGVGEEENFIASDIPAILNYTRDVYLLDDHEIAILTKDEVTVLNKYGEKSGKQVFRVEWDASDAEKGGYDHFMLKEIFDQPKAIRDTMTSRISDKLEEIALDNIKLGKKELDGIEKVYIVACGTAYHAGLVGKYLVEDYARISVEVDIASEFRYRNPILGHNTLVVVISQSGETADTLAAMRLAKGKGAKVLAITNVVGSSVSREAEDVLYTWAGPEIAVASTKAYTTQLVCMYMIALHFGVLRGTLDGESFKRIKKALKQTPDIVQKVIDAKKAIKKFADNNFYARDMFFLGRGLDYYAALEGSLKMKEISYIHSEANPAGELKHGPIALIEEGTIVIALCTQDKLMEKMISNIKEVKARGAYVLAITKENNKSIAKVADEVLYIPSIHDDVAPVPAVVCLQLLAYYFSVARGCDVDKPKNLAKSVTVE